MKRPAARPPGTLHSGRRSRDMLSARCTREPGCPRAADLRVAVLCAGSSVTQMVARTQRLALVLTPAQN
jgi:hypothetical protein